MRFVIIEKQSGLVVNAVEWEGDTETWQPPEGCDARQSDTANIGDTWNGTEFVPAPVEVVPPTAEEVKARRNQLLTTANLRKGALQDAVDIGEATPEEEALLTKYKQYTTKLTRIEQQAGFPADVQWPVAPE